MKNSVIMAAKETGRENTAVTNHSGKKCLTHGDRHRGTFISFSEEELKLLVQHSA